jgi:hypothetical protein
VTAYLPSRVSATSSNVEPTRSINYINTPARRAVCRTVTSVQLSNPLRPGTALTSRDNLSDVSVNRRCCRGSKDVVV